jgi:hypothetical protein
MPKQVVRHGQAAALRREPVNSDVRPHRNRAMDSETLKAGISAVSALWLPWSALHGHTELASKHVQTCMRVLETH